MKKLALILFFPLLTFAQKDSVKVTFSEEEGSLVEKKIVDNSAYFLMLQEPIKQLWKFQIGNTPTSLSSSGNLEYNLTAGYERKISKRLSINALFDIWHRSELATRTFFSLQLEPRIYFKQSVSNLSGMYFSIKSQQYFPTSKTQYNDNNTFQQRFGISLGIQNRFLKNGLIDLGITGGFEFNKISTPIWQKNPDNRTFSFTENYAQKQQKQWFLRSEARVGIGFSGNKNKYKATTCDVFRCFEPQRQMLKIDFTKMFYFSENKKNLDLRIDYEFKLASSSWSINQEFKVGYSYLKESINNYGNSGIFNSTAYGNSWYGGYSFEPRYYYNLKKRIVYGKSANNLSANYISSVNGFDLFERENDYKIEKIHTGVVWGMQRRLVRHGFFDFNGGIAKTLDGTWVDSLFPKKTGLYFVLNFKIGYSL